jgi:hypothetical protein
VREHVASFGQGKGREPPPLPESRRADPSLPTRLESAPPAEHSPRKTARALPTSAQPRRDERLWSLCDAGATLQQICEGLGQAAAEVASQLADGARAGRAIDVPRLLGHDRVQAIRAAAQGTDGDVVALRKRLPFPAALAEIRLALL